MNVLDVKVTTKIKFSVNFQNFFHNVPLPFINSHFFKKCHHKTNKTKDNLANGTILRKKEEDIYSYTIKTNSTKFAITCILKCERRNIHEVR